MANLPVAVSWGRNGVPPRCIPDSYLPLISDWVMNQTLPDDASKAHLVRKMALPFVPRFRRLYIMSTRSKRGTKKPLMKEVILDKEEREDLLAHYHGDQHRSPHAMLLSLKKRWWPSISSDAHLHVMGCSCSLKVPPLRITLPTPCPEDDHSSDCPPEDLSSGAVPDDIPSSPQDDLPPCAQQEGIPMATAPTDVSSCQHTDFPQEIPPVIIEPIPQASEEQTFDPLDQLRDPTFGLVPLQRRLTLSGPQVFLEGQLVVCEIKEEPHDEGYPDSN